MEEVNQTVPMSPVSPTISTPRSEFVMVTPPETEPEDDEVDEDESDMDVLDEDEEVKPLPDDPNLPGCAHYKRKCQLVCPDPKCDKVYTCRICHDEAETSHQLDRYGVKEVVCLTCQLRQPVSNCCVNCSTTFGKFFCKICNLFMDVYKDTFHCDGCGLCRVGPKEKFFHCDKCQMCMPIALGDGKHKCIEKSSRRDCPVCLEDIHTSRSSSHVPPCGHLLHQQCFNQLIRKALYTCPICNQSMVGMNPVWKYLDEQIAASPPLPPELSNEVHILCRDCHEISKVMFHFVGLKCVPCGGYNTCIERGSALNPAAFMNPHLLDQLPQFPAGDDESESEFESAEDDLELFQVDETGNLVTEGTQYEADMEEPGPPLQSTRTPPEGDENQPQ